MKDVRHQILVRMYVMLTVLSIVPLLVAGKVLRIYFDEAEVLRQVGESQANTIVEIPAVRGAVLDRAGRTLVVNTARYDLALDPTVSGFSRVEGTFFDKLSKLTGESTSALRRKVRTRTSRAYVLLARNLSEDAKEAIDGWGIPGLILHPRFDRRYNYGQTAAHVLGHVDTDGRGLAGLEHRYEDFLTGKPGRRAAQRDRRGVIRAVVGGLEVEPTHGETLVLTIDLIRQTILEEELALANVPTYDPNQPAAYSTAARRNRAVTDRIEPGSSFKLISAVAALEKGVVEMEDSVDTGDGWVVFRGRTMRDTHAYGTLSFSEVLAKSSNVGMAKTAAQLEPGDLYQYARNFGFGQPTWIDLPGEVAGLLKKTSQWSGTTLTSMSIGYEIDVTPLQMLMAYSALANGGRLVQPYVVAERRAVTGQTVWQARPDSVRRIFKPETARALLPAFELVVQEGTATEAQVEGLRVAGKTGTARKASQGRYQGGYRATFVGFFPAENPAVAMIVVLDEPKTSIYGGVVSAPIFQRVAQRWVATFPEVAEQMAPTEAILAADERPVPDVIDQPAVVAAHRLRAAGYTVAAPASPLDTVAGQRPEAGMELRPGGRVRLTLAEADTTSPKVMPDFEGLSVREAVFWLQTYGVEVRLEGTGEVVSQWPSEGAALPGEVVIRSR